MNAIEVKGVSKSFVLPHLQRSSIKEHFLHPLRSRFNPYERQAALDNVDLEVKQGEFFGILGLNGSGKSTLLKIMAGIYPADTGEVQVRGKLSPFIELGVGFNPDLTGRDNVLVNGTLLGLTRRELDERFDAILEFAELARFADQKLKNYSSGMQMRLAYSIAIQVEFDVLLLDEVLAVGDQEFQQKCFATFDAFREQGKTIVLVSHSLQATINFCDRAALLEAGRITAIGDPVDVVTAYAGDDRDAW